MVLRYQLKYELLLLVLVSSSPSVMFVNKMHAEDTVIPVKGKPKSGRLWKTEKTRFSSMCQVKPLKLSWEKKMKQRREHQTMLLHAREIQDEKQREIDLYKQRRKEKIQRKLENERKAEVVQVIRNSAKIKRMSKKQLRRVEKRDTNPAPS